MFKRGEKMTVLLATVRLSKEPVEGGQLDPVWVRIEARTSGTIGGGAADAVGAVEGALGATRTEGTAVSTVEGRCAGRWTRFGCGSRREATTRLVGVRPTRSTRSTVRWRVFDGRHGGRNGR